MAALVVASAGAAAADPGTRADRAALFDDILKATLERTAFSPFKPSDIGAGEQVTEADYVRSAMLALRDEFVAADTDLKLYHAITKLTCARWDGHLFRVRLVEGGIQPFAGFGQTGGAAPIKFLPDYGERNAMFLFVSDLARDIARWAGAGARTPQLGDKLVGVNGRPAGAYLKLLGQFVGKSSFRAHWWDLAFRVTVRSRHVAPELFDGDGVTYELETREGVRYTLRLPYVEYESIEWAGHDDHYTAGELADHIRADPDFVRKSHQLRLGLQRYRGFRHVSSRPAFDLYRSSSEKVLLLQGHGFVRATIVADLDHLLDYARAEGLFDHAVIYDLTRGSGGDFEEYTLQRLQPRPFRLMFGNLRISEITPALVQRIREAAVKALAEAPPRAAPPILARDVEQPDGGRYLIEWLDRDVAAAIRAGQAYTNDVPFKGQFLPAASDGYLYPAKEHFTGPMALLTAPSACSGADQFAAMFIDNGLGLSVGMPEGGCSNTWEWDEVLKFKHSGRPVTTFGWSVGHSIRPNGEVLEGNPAVPDIVVPLTRDNHAEYYDILMGHALRYIRAQRASSPRPPTKLEKLTQPRR